MAELSQHLTLLSEPVRVRLLAALTDHELSVGELVRVLQLPQSTVSRHLDRLRKAGWVRRRSEGPASLYRAASLSAASPRSQIWTVVLEDFCDGAQRHEDIARLETVLSARRMDSRTFFGRMHSEWSGLRDQLYGRDFWLPTLLALLPEDLVVADLGCGTGEALVQLAPYVSRVVGVDREPAMLAAARTACVDLDAVVLREGGIEDLPLSDAELDVALAMLVLHHVDDLEAAFVEIRRVIKPGGRLIVLDMVRHDRVDWAESMGHAHLGFGRDQLHQLAAGAGLRLQSWRTLVPVEAAQGPPLFVAVVSR